MPLALLHFTEAWLLGTAVSLQRCPLARSSLRPRSLAQLSSRGPAQGSPFSAPTGLPPGVPGAPGEGAGKQAEGMADVSSFSQGQRLLSNSVISHIGKTTGHENSLSLCHRYTGHPDSAREGSLLALQREGMQLSQLSHLLLCFQPWRQKGT